MRQYILALKDTSYRQQLLFISKLSLGLLLLAAADVGAQSTVSGSLVAEGEPVIYANVSLMDSENTLYKVETTDLEGDFIFGAVEPGEYTLVCTYVGMEEISRAISVANDPIELGEILMSTASIELGTAVVTAQRAMVEVKPDKTVFNVQGTINATGDNALTLLRKAPSVLVDNNNNVSVMSRTGVLVYVDGKRLPLSGDDLTAYLENLPSDQIDRMDIITNPGARYEAEGNAGIIDIRLVKDKSLGYNGTAGITYSSGRRDKFNANLSGNYRNRHMNTFGTVGLSDGIGFQQIFFDGYQNGFRLLSEAISEQDRKGYNYRLGTDFFVSKKSTVGFLVTGQDMNENSLSTNDNQISSFTAVDTFDSTPSDVTIPFDQIDSLLIAQNIGDNRRKASTFNLNYAYNSEGRLLNFDVDYGRYRNTATEIQPNTYLSRDSVLLRESNFSFDTPRDIDIWSAKVDYETSSMGGQLGFGAKYTNINTANTFLFFDVPDEVNVQNDFKSNLFDYSERVTAGYVSFSKQLNQKWGLTSGLRLEHTDTNGELTAFREELQEDPVEQNYLSAFPSFGLTYQAQMGNTWSFNYGRRINRPDYNVLNPFRQQLTELNFSLGNPRLLPEIVNNVEFGYTYKWRFNFKLGYSFTQDKITRLIGTDPSDPKASFINWDNLAEQHIYSLNASLPFQFTSWWTAYFNINGNFQKNLAENEFGTIDVSAWGWSAFQQQTFTLGKGYTAELSGWFSGPGVWGGVFLYEPSFALNVGIQKRFINDKLNVRLAANDVFNTGFWRGSSEFAGLLSFGQGFWDAQRGSISVSYNFGNNEVKSSRKRETGIEAESKRVGESEGQG